MAITAIIGAVMFQTWDMTAQSGADVARITRERERERIVFALLDNDLAGMIFSGEENRRLPSPSTEPIEISDEFYEAMGRKKEDNRDKNSRTLLSFASETSVGEDAGSPGYPVCVEYVLRLTGTRHSLVRRERDLCGVSGDFPWTEAELMDNIERAAFEMIFQNGKKLAKWQKEDLTPPPIAIRLAWTPAGGEEREFLFPVFSGGADVEWEE